jgi:hypothetical protein
MRFPGFGSFTGGDPVPLQASDFRSALSPLDRRDPETTTSHFFSKSLGLLSSGFTHEAMATT